ncbi:hypothetical protein RYX36_036094, partial [Vicia faba]
PGPWAWLPGPRPALPLLQQLDLDLSDPNANINGYYYGNSSFLHGIEALSLSLFNLRKINLSSHYYIDALLSSNNKSRSFFCSQRETINIEGMVMDALVAVGVIQSRHLKLDTEHIEEAMHNILVCMEMKVSILIFNIMLELGTILTSLSAIIDGPKISAGGIPGKGWTLGRLLVRWDRS